MTPPTWPDGSTGEKTIYVCECGWHDTKPGRCLHPARAIGPEMEPVPVYPASLVDELVGALEYLEVSIGRVNYDGEIGDVEDLDEARRVAAERLANFHRATGGDDD